MQVHKARLTVKAEKDNSQIICFHSTNFEDFKILKK